MKKVIFGFLGLVLLCSCIGLVGKWFFMAELFTHFRLQAIIAAFVLLPVVIWLRDWVSVGVAVLILGINAAVILPAYMAVAPVKADASAANLRVLSANMLFSNTDMTSLNDMVAAHSPDIVLVVEANDAAVTAMQAMADTYPYTVAYPQNDNGIGIAVWAKKPFSVNALIPDPHVPSPLLELTFDDVRFYAAHPLPPISLAMDRHQKAYIRKMAELIRQSDRPVVAAGDFNATLWAQNLRPLRDAGVKTANDKIFGWTWPRFLPMAIQIDHVFVKGMRVADFKTLSINGSDHRAVLADLQR